MCKVIRRDDEYTKTFRASRSFCFFDFQNDCTKTTITNKKILGENEQRCVLKNILERKTTKDIRTGEKGYENSARCNNREEWGVTTK